MTSAGSTAKLLTFVGTTPNIGTTVASFAAAYQIARQSGKQVGFLCMNLKSAKLHRYLGKDRPIETLDTLRPELRSASLTPAKLLRAAAPMQGCPGLHILFGNLLRDQAEFFTAGDMEHLLAVARETFAVIVADVSAYWDNAATVTALRAADARLLTTTPALSNFQEDGKRWIEQVSPLFGIEQADYEAIIIYPPWRSGGFPMRDIRKETGLPVIGNLHLTESVLSHLDSGRLGEWLERDERGKQAMKEVSGHLMKKHAISYKQTPHFQPWYRKLLAHRGGVGS
ncbi:hypothetical protein EBB07_21585 [Paenibacillaceae bacterium]|nr:hypothetical protein EBB07_21585 [Paenibacillaceae bacterium]